MDLEGKTLTGFNGEYSLNGVIGQGGFGVVWKAKDQDGKDLAVKTVKPNVRGESEEDRLMMLREGILQMHLDNSQVIGTHDSAVDKETQMPFVAMDLKSYSFRDVLKGSRNFKPQFLDDIGFWVIKRSAEVLSYLHEKGVYHVDFKPENMLFAQRQMVVSDLGLARLSVESPLHEVLKKELDKREIGYEPPTSSGDEQDYSMRTQTSAWVQRRGSPKYTALEAQNPKGEIDARADVYSLAIIISDIKDKLGLTVLDEVVKSGTAGLATYRPQSVSALMEHMRDIRDYFSEGLRFGDLEPNDQVLGELRQYLEEAKEGYSGPISRIHDVVLCERTIDKWVDKYMQPKVQELGTYDPSQMDLADMERRSSGLSSIKELGEKLRAIEREYTTN